MVLTFITGIYIYILYNLFVQYNTLRYCFSRLLFELQFFNHHICILDKTDSADDGFFTSLLVNFSGLSFTF